MFKTSSQILKYFDKVNKQYWDTVERARHRRSKKLLKYQSTLCYCPNCDNELITTGSFLLSTDLDEPPVTIVMYRCTHCQNTSKWIFGLTPAPILIKSDKELEDLLYGDYKK